MSEIALLEGHPVDIGRRMAEHSWRLLIRSCSSGIRARSRQGCGGVSLTGRPGAIRFRRMCGPEARGDLSATTAALVTDLGGPTLREGARNRPDRAGKFRRCHTPLHTNTQQRRFWFQRYFGMKADNSDMASERLLSAGRQLLHSVSNGKQPKAVASRHALPFEPNTSQ